MISVGMRVHYEFKLQLVVPEYCDITINIVIDRIDQNRCFLLLTKVLPIVQTNISIN